MSEERFGSIPAYGNEQEEEERRNLRTKIGETIIIEEALFESSNNYGEFIVLYCREGKFYNFSKRLQKQLRPYSGEGGMEKPLKARVMLSEKNQVYLTKPDLEE